jgi:hypothetical protein
LVYCWGDSDGFHRGIDLVAGNVGQDEAGLTVHRLRAKGGL